MKADSVVTTTIDKCGIPAVQGLVLGLLVGFDEDGTPLVDYPGNPSASAILSRSTTLLTEQDCGRDAALLFEGGDPTRPVIVGLMQSPVNQRRVEIQGQDEVLLRCGEASITLRRNGRVIIRGTYVESRSKGTNRIKGGVVLIN
jgi:hypothetical protein